MTEEKLNQANLLSSQIYNLERATKYSDVKTYGIHDICALGIITPEEFDKILDDANEEIRRRARALLVKKKKEFEEL